MLWVLYLWLGCTALALFMDGPEEAWEVFCAPFITFAMGVIVVVAVVCAAYQSLFGEKSDADR